MGRGYAGVLLLLVLVLYIPSFIVALNVCSADSGGGVCPDHNECCATKDPEVSSCITAPASHQNGPGVCCSDDGVGVTGCGAGYECASFPVNNVPTSYCRLVDGRRADKADELPHRLPRYRLCSVPRHILERVHSLSIASGRPDLPQLVYYSTMGALDSTVELDQAKMKQKDVIRNAVVVVHGSGRNADDYLCCAVSALSMNLTDSSIPEETIVVAPRFLVPSDGTVHVTNSSIDLLRWNETDPIPHTWRYGANAINANVSSYDAMDALVNRLAAELPSLERLIVAGHSAGGQFAQRWALTSSIDAWESKLVSLRVVVANPRSFCYLDARRVINGTLRMPSAKAIHACPTYNQWEWGLDSGGDLPTPYKERSLKKVGGISNMTERYIHRNVIYLAGAMDVLPVQAGCEDDDFQGKNRRERSRLFFGALNEINATHRHQRHVLWHVPHDHCLVFQSATFRAEVFGGFAGRTSSDNLVVERGASPTEVLTINDRFELIS